MIFVEHGSPSVCQMSVPSYEGHMSMRFNLVNMDCHCGHCETPLPDAWRNERGSSFSYVRPHSRETDGVQRFELGRTACLKHAQLPV